MKNLKEKLECFRESIFIFENINTDSKTIEANDEIFGKIDTIIEYLTDKIDDKSIIALLKIRIELRKNKFILSETFNQTRIIIFDNMSTILNKNGMELENDMIEIKDKYKIISKLDSFSSIEAEIKSLILELESSISLIERYS